jgi:hypothetical protein
VEHIAPLLQTVLWVALIAGIVWQFHKPIQAILTALHKRIDEGGGIKVGPVELTPQDPAGQRAKLAQEVTEIALPEPSPQRALPPGPRDAAKPVEPFRSKYLQAEDLALRAVQAEYGIAVSRQVTAGADVGFDGAFVLGGRFHIVEVKLIPAGRPVGSVRTSLGRLKESIARYGWRNVQIVLAAVFEDPADVGPGVQRLEEVAAGGAVHVAVRAYGLDDLRNRFGIVGGPDQAAD